MGAVRVCFQRMLHPRTPFLKKIHPAVANSTIEPAEDLRNFKKQGIKGVEKLKILFSEHSNALCNSLVISI